MTLRLLLTLISFPLFAPSLFCQAAASADSTKAATYPPIPEEARRHFIMGTTLFKDARNTADFSRVTSEFKQATELAPQWPEARYHLALAREAAGDYSGAMADLKLYQQFNLSDAEARAVQDKIYVLEAKQEEAGEKQADEQKAAAAKEQKKQEYRDKVGFLAGQWNVASTFHCSCAWDGRVYQSKVMITINGKNLLITNQPSGVLLAKGTMEGDDYTSIQWMRVADTSAWPRQIGRLADCSIAVTVDKPGQQISWKEPTAEQSMPPIWTWDSSCDVQLTR
ncbi:MAG TPA: hypothetical protein VNV15_06095 [Opitutaceae bacterium]|jgi:hypothetical protein|nr:hypothetical protein [Opitutaceae bacterium]